MAILKLARMGHPVLRRKADAVSDPTAEDVKRLVADMIDTLEDSGGVGLAAPQIHVSRRVVIFRVPSPEDQPEELTVLINPEVELLPGPVKTGWEGCLSVPGLRGGVPRAARIRYRGFNLAGVPVEREAEGHHARIVQHECDHLDGFLFPQRMTDFRLLAFAEEWQRYGAEFPLSPNPADE